TSGRGGRGAAAVRGRGVGPPSHVPAPQNAGGVFDPPAGPPGAEPDEVMFLNPRREEMYELDTKCVQCGEMVDGDRPTTHRHCEGCGEVMSRREASIGSLCDRCYQKALD